MGSGFFGKRQIWPQVGVHKLFISHPVDSDSPLIVVCMGSGESCLEPLCVVSELESKVL